MHILFAFITAAAVIGGSLNSLYERSNDQQAKLSSWAFFINRVNSYVDSNNGVDDGESTEDASDADQDPTIGAGQTTFTMDWNIPSERLNGGSLSTADIRGYELYYTSVTKGLNETIFVNDPSQTSYEFADVEPGTYQIAIAAIEATGLRSPTSETIEITVN
jgi:hypothetical protein